MHVIENVGLFNEMVKNFMQFCYVEIAFCIAMKLVEWNKVRVQINFFVKTLESLKSKKNININSLTKREEEQYI